jgi:WD40 repeat protein
MRELKLAKDDYVYTQAVSVNRAALGIGDGPIHVFDLTQRQLRPPRINIAGQNKIHSMAISRNGTLLAAGYEEGYIRVVDLDGRSLQVIADIEAHREWVSHLHITDAGRLCSVGLDGVICLSDAKQRRVLSRLTSEEGWGDCVLEEDGSTVWVAGGRGGPVHRLQYAGDGVVVEDENNK